MNCPTCGAPRAPTEDGDWDYCSHDLVAAAPELLAALRDVIQVVIGMHPHSSEVWAKVHAAIAKAEGRGE